MSRPYADDLEYLEGRFGLLDLRLQAREADPADRAALAERRRAQAAEHEERRAAAADRTFALEQVARRYALELERHPGVVALTTNRKDALERRLALKLELGVPARSERERIWRRHLPARGGGPGPAPEAEMWAADGGTRSRPA